MVIWSWGAVSMGEQPPGRTQGASLAARLHTVNTSLKGSVVFFAVVSLYERERERGREDGISNITKTRLTQLVVPAVPFYTVPRFPGG